MAINDKIEAAIWHRDENGNLSREHVSVPEHHPLTGRRPRG